MVGGKTYLTRKRYHDIYHRVYRVLYYSVHILLPLSEKLSLENIETQGVLVLWTSSELHPTLL